LSSANTILKIPEGYAFLETGKVGEADIKPNKNDIEITIKKHGLVVVVLRKN
jgi:hypothetical protein